MNFDNISAGTRIEIALSSEISLGMIYCPPGNFMMGAGENDIYGEGFEKPQRQVVLTKGFWISETPITRRQLGTIIDTKPKNYESSWDSPASQYTWEEVIDFCKIFTDRLASIALPFVAGKVYQFDLPTEAQWEYACRAGTNTTWYFGNNEEELKNHAWYGLPGSAKLPEVKLKKQNAWGIYDLYGMVSEWCLDSFRAYRLIKHDIDPMIDNNYARIESTSPLYVSSLIQKVIRGGCINDRAPDCRSAARTMLDTFNFDNELTGFRLVINEV